jgi:hypothetical protein
MFWRSKRKQIKGWALDIEDNGPYGGFRERLASSSKLWTTCMVLLLASVVLVIVRSGNVGQSIASGDLIESPVGVYTDDLHKDFVRQLKETWEARGVPNLKAEFLSDRTLRITIPDDLGRDEIAYLSRFAAIGIWRRFGVSPTVWTYIRGNSKPTATATWRTSRGDFGVEFNGPSGTK